MAKKTNRRKQEIKEGESKAERFIRVVSPRVNKAVKAIKVVGYCSGSTYEWSPAQIKQIFDVLRSAVDSVAGRFESKPQADATFAFED